jgi:hypothetical protein
LGSVLLGLSSDFWVRISYGFYRNPPCFPLACCYCNDSTFLPDQIQSRERERDGVIELCWRNCAEAVEGTALKVRLSAGGNSGENKRCWENVGEGKQTTIRVKL